MMSSENRSHFSASCSELQFNRGKHLMSKAAIAIACVCLLTLSGCGNTAYGLKKDGQEASHAMDNATHRVLSAGAKK
jgi:predicted small secreted protein